MATYIERETYRNRLADLESWCQDLRKPGLKQALEMFDEVPAADVAPVVHGVWDVMGGTKTRRICSKCKWDVPEYGKFYSYCPNCGAKMDGGDNDAVN